MKTPRKIYLVISKKAKGKYPLERDQAIHSSRKGAQDRADYLNARKVLGVDDWRVETFVKGD